MVAVGVDDDHASREIEAHPSHLALGRPASRRTTPRAATLDLTRAYNMPCAYTDFATCPVPPPENTLPFAVEAGEQIPTFSP